MNELKAPKGNFVAYLVDVYGRENMPEPVLKMCNPNKETVLGYAAEMNEALTKKAQEPVQPSVDYIVTNLMDGSGRFIEPEIRVVDDQGNQIH